MMKSYSIVGLPEIPKIPDIPTLHTGTGPGGFHPANGADEGIALLQRGETVLPRGQTRAAGAGVHIASMHVWNAREAARAIAEEQAWSELTSAR